jgi:cytochrome bd-type quinol oxidase subunit 2
MKIIKKLRVAMASLGWLLVSLPVHAQTVLENNYEKLGPFADVYNMRGLLESEGTRRELIVRVARVLNVFLGLLVLIMVILIMYGGYLWLTARGNEQQVEDAKHTIKSAVIGTIIIMMSVAITVFVVRGINRALLD